MFSGWKVINASFIWGFFQWSQWTSCQKAAQKLPPSRITFPKCWLSVSVGHNEQEAACKLSFPAYKEADAMTSSNTRFRNIFCFSFPISAHLYLTNSHEVYHNECVVVHAEDPECVCVLP